MRKNLTGVTGKRCLLALFLAGASALSIAQEICALPAKIEQPVPRKPDYVNADKPTDYLALVLSWSPQHCEEQRNQPSEIQKKHEFQCFSKNRFEWVVHGLWPQNGKAASNREHPRHCKTSDALHGDVVRQHLCMMPGAELMQNEWQAHGTCGWATSTAYFIDIQKAYSTLTRPTTDQMVGAGHGTNRLVDSSGAGVKAAFLKLNPSLSADNMRVNVAAGNRLKEIWVCLGKDLKPTACPPGGTPDKQAITVRTPHN